MKAIRLKHFFRFTKRQVGAWWVHEFEWVAKPFDGLKPRHCSPYDPKLPLAGSDTNNTLYSRKDKETANPKIVDYIPTGYEICSEKVAITQSADAEILLYILRSDKDRVYLLQAQKDYPRQVSTQKDFAKCYPSGKTFEETLLWVQQNPKLQIARNYLQHKCPVNLWTTVKNLAREEWEQLGRQVITSKSKPSYTSAEVAAKKYQPGNYTIPATTLEEAEADYGVKPGSQVFLYQGKLECESWFITDHTKAVKRFSELQHLPQVTKVCQQPPSNTYDLTNNQENLLKLGKCLKPGPISISIHELRVLPKDLQWRLLPEFLTLNSYTANHVLTHPSRVNQLFVPELEAVKQYKISSQVTKYFEGTIGYCYLRRDLEKCPLRNMREEFKVQRLRHDQLLAVYPRLPRTWTQATDTQIKKWQDIQRQVDAGTMVRYHDLPVFREMLSDDKRWLQVADWLKTWDSNAVTDYDGVIYCPPYQTLDELAQLPQAGALFKQLFQDPLVQHLLHNSKAQAHIITEQI